MGARYAPDPPIEKPDTSRNMEGRMPNLAHVLKDEIRRLARREIKAELGPARKVSAQYRRDIAALKRQLRDQGRQIAALERADKKAPKADPE